MTTCTHCGKEMTHGGQCKEGHRPLRIGDKIYGYCEGIFGRDSLRDKRVEAIGTDWVVVREDDGGPNFVVIDPEALRKYLQDPDA